MKLFRSVRVVVLLFPLTWAGAALADIGSGSVILGVFSDPVLQGNIIPLAGGQSYYDNSQTASYLISNSTDGTLGGTPPGQQTGSQLTWGNTPGFSSLVFFGKPVAADPTTPFDLGTIEFGNGTSQLSSLIFGATMTFYLGQPGPNTIVPGAPSIGSSALDIVTTANLGVAGSEAHDADFISLSGLANQTFNVFEGAYASAELYGYITGDPVLHLTSIVLNPGQEANGFIGNGQPVPEPTSLALGLVGIGVGAAYASLSRRRSRRGERAAGATS